MNILGEGVARSCKEFKELQGVARQLLNIFIEERRHGRKAAPAHVE
jgi:hypothetical protein